MKPNTSDKFEIIVDFQGKHIRLYEHTVNHIRMRHPEIKDPREFVKKILEHPILVTEDELPDTVIYHRAIKKPILHVAYV